MRTLHMMPIALLLVGYPLLFWPADREATGEAAPIQPSVAPDAIQHDIVPGIAPIAPTDGFWREFANEEPQMQAHPPAASQRRPEPVDRRNESIAALEYRAAQNVDESVLAGQMGLSIAEFRDQHGDFLDQRLADEFLTQELMKDRLNSLAPPQGQSDAYIEKTARDAAERTVRGLAPAVRAQVLRQRIDSTDAATPIVRRAEPQPEPWKPEYTVTPASCDVPTHSPRICS